MNPKATASVDYAPREGSVAWRVIEFLTTNPDESLSAEEVSIKFGCGRTSVHSSLGPAAATGALKRAKDLKGGKLVYTLGNGVPGIAAVPARHPVAGAAAIDHALAGKKKPRRFWCDVSSIVIDKDVPMPSSYGMDWFSVFDRMQPGDSFALPMQAKASVSNASTSYKKAKGIRLVIRKADGGLRVWRVENEEAA